MNMHLHQLTGCAPAPLAYYLKALGILRLVSEQADSQARGWWQDEHFCLSTKLDREELNDFFLFRYAPTPFVSPWNKGSGFYQVNDPGLAPLEESESSRFAAFRAGIAVCRSQLEELSTADAAVREIKDRTKAKKGMTEAKKSAAIALKNDPEFKRELAIAERRFKALKADLFAPCRQTWRGPHREWMDAAVVFPELGNPIFPSLLGTGGNDGRLDFTNNAMKRLGELFDLADSVGMPAPVTRDLLQNSLWLTTSKSLALNAAIGQFLPGSAGGSNSTTAADGGSLVNPWDFILMLEGAILFRSRITKRLSPTDSSQASVPFAVRAHAAGFGTPGAENSSRGEQWMPLWSKPATLSELRSLLSDAQMQLGRQAAHRPIDVVRAISRLGVARGIDAFTRFGYLERNGQSTLAIPLDRIHVQHRPQSRLVDDLAPWMERLQRLARDKNAPERLIRAERRLADSVLAALTHDATFDRWQAILLAAVNVEVTEAVGAGTAAGPIPRLSPGWIAAVDDGSPEVRLAIALGSAAAQYSNGRPVDSIRHHWLPLKPGARQFNTNEKRLVRDPRVVANGRSAIADCIAIVERRLTEAAARGRRKLPLVAAVGCGASLSDLAALISGNVDLTRVLNLARAFMAIRWDSWVRNHRLPEHSRTVPDESWLAIRLNCLAWQLGEDRDIATEPSVIRCLASGNATLATKIACARLRSSGIRAPVQSVVTDTQTAHLWAAALIFPISRATARRAIEILQPNLTGDRNG